MPAYVMSLRATVFPPLKIKLFSIFSAKSYYKRNFGRMDAVDSEITQTEEIPAQERVPLSGEALNLAIKAMESPDFLAKLIARIMKEARKMGFHSPFSDSMDLPGGKSVADLAGDIIEKAMAGFFTWDRERSPDFQHFCISRARSILSNWLDRMKHFITVSPLPEADPESGDLLPNAITRKEAPDDIYLKLRLKDGEALGDRFLEDFALSLPDGSVEQRIIMSVFDDRECGNRAYCRGKTGLSESDYDAGIKRIIRKVGVFSKEWRNKNGINLNDWKEAL